MSDRLSLAVIGAGRMGAEHIKRIAGRVAGAEVSLVVDVDAQRAEAAAAAIGGARVMTDPQAALAEPGIDGVVLATPGAHHRDVLMDAIDRRLPVLCEKPLAADAATARALVDAEARHERPLIQLGFMRRFDAGYQRLRALFESNELGGPLMLHCVHRNPASPPGFTEAMLIYDSVVHEFDAVRYFTGEEIRRVGVRKGRASRLAARGLADPQQVLIETESNVLVDVEIFVNAQFGYAVTAQAVFEQGTADIGSDAGAYVRRAGRWGGEVTPDFEARFGAAFDAEFRAWVDDLRAGRPVSGPTVWDGYAAAVCCEAGVAAQRGGGAVDVALGERPELYR